MEKRRQLLPPQDKERFLKQDTKDTNQRGRLKKSDYIKNKNIFLSQYTMNKVKIQAREWEVICVMNKTGKTQVSRTYKEILQISEKITT